MKQWLKRLLGAHPPLLEWARNGIAVSRGRRVGADRFLRFAPPGHYYSPLPDEAAWRAAVRHHPAPQHGLPGLNLRLDEQSALFRQLTPRLRAFQPPAEPTADRRYYAHNDFFQATEAALTAALLVTDRPRRVIEVGSGFSSALLLDAAEGLAQEGHAVHFTFLDPDPVRLDALLRPADRTRAQVIRGLAQEQPQDFFTGLEAGDWLFIDSSHVAKCGSDVVFLLLEVLPRLRAGVTVHLHDIFWPFEYPASWYAEGRAWNEAYFVRALLQDNPRWRIRFWNDCFVKAFPGLAHEVWPGTASLGASLWLRREEG